MTVFAYLLGVLLHVATKWASAVAKGQGNYLRRYWALNLVGAGAAVAGFTRWESGELPEVLRLVGQGIVNGVAALAGEPARAVVAPTGPWAAFAAGYVMDSVARTTFLAIEGWSLGVGRPQRTELPTRGSRSTWRGARAPRSGRAARGVACRREGAT